MVVNNHYKPSKNMNKGIKMITNHFKLINYMSFGESVFSAGFIQKTVKIDQDIRFNSAYHSENNPRMF